MLGSRDKARKHFFRFRFRVGLFRVGLDLYKVQIKVRVGVSVGSNILPCSENAYVLLPNKRPVPCVYLWVGKDAGKLASLRLLTKKFLKHMGLDPEHVEIRVEKEDDEETESVEFDAYFAY